MSELWVPAMEPPQIDEDAKNAMLSRLRERGVIKVASVAVTDIRDDHKPYDRHLDRWGRELNGLSEEGIWPLDALKMGAALALAAYREAGYYQTIDDTAVEIGDFVAEMQGVPDIYIMSLNEDLRLQAVIAAASRAPEFLDDEGGMVQVLGLGAGSARHYLQQAIAA